MQLCWPFIMAGENTASIISKNKMYSCHFHPHGTTFETLNIKQKAYENN